MPSQIAQRASRSMFFWALGSKAKGKAGLVLLQIAAARLMKSIDARQSQQVSVFSEGF